MKTIHPEIDCNKSHYFENMYAAITFILNKFKIKFGYSNVFADACNTVSIRAISNYMRAPYFGNFMPEDKM